MRMRSLFISASRAACANRARSSLMFMSISVMPRTLPRGSDIRARVYHVYETRRAKDGRNGRVRRVRKRPVSYTPYTPAWRALPLPRLVHNVHANAAGLPVGNGLLLVDYL